jgi:hypothetical protein
VAAEGGAEKERRVAASSVLFWIAKAGWASSPRAHPPKTDQSLIDGRAVATSRRENVLDVAQSFFSLIRLLSNARRDEPEEMRMPAVGLLGHAPAKPSIRSIVAGAKFQWFGPAIDWRIRSTVQQL